MSAFYIWNPSILQNNTQRIELILTNGDTGYGILRDQQFVENILRDLKIEAKIKDWSIIPYRSNYYSEYLDEDDWRDRWQIIWKLSILTKETIIKSLKESFFWIGTNATGNDWWDGPNDDDPIHCLVISDFCSDTNIQKAQQDIIHLENCRLFRHKYSVELPIFSFLEVSNKYKQLQIDLGQFSPIFFAQGADYAEYVLTLCKQLGGIVNCQDHL